MPKSQKKEEKKVYPAQARYAEEKTRAGCKRLTLWVHEDHVAKVRKLAKASQHPATK